MESVMVEETRQLNARIPEELHQRLKVAAARTGRPMGELVAEAVEQYLARIGG